MTKRPHSFLAEIATALDSSAADILGGRVVPADEVDRMIQARIDRTEARLSAGLSRSITAGITLARLAGEGGERE